MWRIFILLFFATNSLAELPPSPSFIGEIKRSEQGKLIVVPASQNEQALPPSPERQPVTVDRKINTKMPDSPDPGATHQDDPATQAAQSTKANNPPKCSSGAITCIEAISTGNKSQASVPLTFGQPFKANDLPKGSRLLARDNSGNLPIQMDEESSHRDGSIRFAVLSTQITDLKPGEKRVINLYKDPSPIAQTVAPEPDPSAFDIKLAAKIYSPQITQITFGNRSGTTPGIPFEAGEEITLQLGDAAEERFSHRVTAEQAGGSFPNLTRLAEAFRDLINSRSQQFKAYKLGEGGGYEKLWITTKRTDGQAFSVKFVYSGKARTRRHQPSNIRCTPTFRGFRQPGTRTGTQSPYEAAPARPGHTRIRAGRSVYRNRYRKEASPTYRTTARPFSRKQSASPNRRCTGKQLGI